MKVHEYQAKEILGQFGVPVPSGKAALTAAGAVDAARALGGDRWGVKAQGHAGRSDCTGKAPCKIPCTCTYVRNNITGVKLKLTDHLIRFLPRVP